MLHGHERFQAMQTADIKTYHFWNKYGKRRREGWGVERS